MKQLNRTTHNFENRPLKVLQFGEGNFLRAFMDLAIHRLNKKGLTNIGVTIAHSFPISNKNFHNQNGLYTVIESSDKGKNYEIVDCLQEQFYISEQFDKYLQTAENLDINVIISNTTESGIVYQLDNQNNPISFPARLAVWLNHRFTSLQKSNKNDKVFIIPCELIEANGSTLKKNILQHAKQWEFSPECMEWINSCYFYDTLVDRIVPGYPKNFINEFQQDWGYIDNYAVLAEEFFLLAIQGNTKELDKILPLSQLDLNIIYTDNLSFYRDRKVAVLNGAHTLTVCIALLLDHLYVADSLEDQDINTFMQNYLRNDVSQILEESLETEKYINSIISRFKNTYLEHQWNSIVLNSLAKFNTRNLPILLSMNTIPYYGLFSLATLWYYYTLENRQDTQYSDFKKILEHSHSIEDIANNLSECETLYPQGLPKEWKPILINYYKDISNNPRKALQKIILG